MAGCGQSVAPTTAPAPTAAPVEVIKEVKPWLPEKWDREADVVIVGAGGTGVVAAIEAASAGTRVLVVEKAPVAGGSTILSGGCVEAAGTPVQRAAGIDDDSAEKQYQFWIAAGEGRSDPELVRVMADNSAGNLQWLMEQGIEYHGLMGVTAIAYVDPELFELRNHIPGPAGSPAMNGGAAKFYFPILYQSAEDKGAEFLLETPATSLVRDPEKGVIGVRVESDGKEMYIKAKKGVVLATSSFDYNKEMARAFSPQQLWALEAGNPISCPTNTGDGIKMAMEIGADLAGLGGTIGIPSPGIGQAAAPGIWVNRYGQRFINEASHYAFASRAIFNQEQHLAWAVFDDKVMQQSGAALGLHDVVGEGTASEAVKKANTLQDLAQILGVSAGALEATVAKWNEGAANGEDTVFGKVEGLQAIDQGPYYAVQLYETSLGALGGVTINTHAQVLDVYGMVIPRLYAGGQAAGGIMGPYYNYSGGGVGTTVCFGRIAGKNAAAEKPWE
jgi:urocanate reductase